MKAGILAVCLALLSASPSWAFQWSANDYIDQCSVVHKQSLSPNDLEVIAHCIGIIKGAFAGLLMPRVLENAAETGMLSLPLCSLEGSQKSMFDLTKNVIATIKLNYSEFPSLSQPNTASGTVAFALIELYPCLLE